MLAMKKAFSVIIRDDLKILNNIQWGAVLHITSLPETGRDSTLLIIQPKISSLQNSPDHAALRRFDA
ncbi:hypothetical protein [Photorhabdus cinerea]|uniref:hypothetical protein n=1 Tax=Photorhabdus cinerea TaxID=471575 RepID=UPI00140D4728|nr:hypothetical protein [Photorhabdus cinerea]